MEFQRLDADRLVRVGTSGGDFHTDRISSQGGLLGLDGKDKTSSFHLYLFEQEIVHVRLNKHFDPLRSKNFWRLQNNSAPRYGAALARICLR